MNRKKTGKTLLGIYRKLFAFFGPQHWWPGDSPFEVAVGAILTQNTNWSNVEKAIRNIRREGLLGAKALHGLPHDRLASLIRPAGYFNIKAQRLQSFLDFLMHDYGGSMKRMGKRALQPLRQELLQVHGIGPETADSILLYALDKPVFVIDAYTKRLLSRHGIMDYDKPYDEFQALFHESLEADVRLFNEYHALIVMAGKDYCKPTPKCEECPLRNNHREHRAKNEKFKM